VTGDMEQVGWLRRKIQARLLKAIQKYTLARFREEGDKHGSINLPKVKEELEQTCREGAPHTVAFDGTGGHRPAHRGRGANVGRHHAAALQGVRLGMKPSENAARQAKITGTKQANSPAPRMAGRDPRTNVSKMPNRGTQHTLGTLKGWIVGVVSVGLCFC